MTPWLILRTTPGHERDVESDLNAIPECAAWVPELLYMRARKQPSKPAAVVVLGCRAVMPGWMFAAVPIMRLGALHSVEHFKTVQRPTLYDLPYIVPDAQITAFREILDAENRFTEAMYRRRMERGKVKKPKSKKFKDFREAGQYLFGGFGAEEDDFQDAA